MVRLAAPLLFLALAGPATAGYIDSINPNAVIVPNTDYSTSFYGTGWLYTPTQSYTLTGIYSQFQAIGSNGTGSRTMTVQIQTAPPIDGGTILGQGTFTGDSATGGTLGVDFAPVMLMAGTTYFVDFLNIGGMSLDLGQWADVGGTHVATAGATTRLSDWFVASGSDRLFSSDRMGYSADEALATGNASGLEPILLFAGSPAAVPEPSSLLMLAIGLGGAGWKMRRRSR